VQNGIPTQPTAINLLWVQLTLPAWPVSHIGTTECKELWRLRRQHAYHPVRLGSDSRDNHHG
jgi:hypothetical protein